MRGSKDTAGMPPDVQSRQAFFRFEIVCQDRPLEVKLESTHDFYNAKMRAARGPFFGMTFGHIVSLPILSLSSAAAFRGLDSDNRNGVRFVTSQPAREIIAPAAFLNIRPNSSSEGERCMKHTVHALAGILKNYRNEWKPNPDGFLFVTRNERPPSSNNVVEHRLWPILDSLEIPRCGLHAFRHTHTALLLNSGATPKVVQRQLRRRRSHDSTDLRARRW